MRLLTFVSVALLPLVLARPQLAYQLSQKPVVTAASNLDMIPKGTEKNELDEIIAASELLSLHRSLSEIESISNNERDVGDFLAQYLQQQGLTVEKQYVPRDGEEDDGQKHNKSSRFNIYAYPPSSPTPEIILTSHIDTVPPYIPYSLSLPPRNSPDHPFSIDRRAIHISGRGTVDAKASVACQTIAALSHLKSHPITPLGLLFVVSEETGGRGMHHFSNDSRLNPSPPTFHTVIFGEPTEQKLVSGHKGIVHFSVHVRGKPAHSGYPWLGRSAVSAMLPILSKLDTLGDIPESEGGLPRSKKYGKSTLNIGVVKAGVATNVVPASAFALVAVRLAGGTVAHAQETIAAAVREASKHRADDVRLDFSGSGGYAPVDLDTDVDGFDVTTVNYGTDVPNWDIHDGDQPKDKKVKRYLYGPGSILVAHGENEGLSVGDMEDAVEGYGRLIRAAVERKQKK
ncbi:M20 family metallopeptidase [Emydomyces testavorans]|uniref:M20 family metallopeptidase n=1 Tax=Emydomyces testavorans TaxID=2070801 RepID=A0AAF0DP49_9EURO|nr:M20 family metallopeptidase [Emydomyces testavorans]